MSDIEYRLAIPEAAAFVALFESTGWDPEGRLTVDAARDALAHTWCAVSAYDHDRLVGTGRVVGDQRFGRSRSGHGRPHRGRHGQLREQAVDQVMGACFLIRRELLNTIDIRS